MGRLQTLDLRTRPEPHGGLELSHLAYGLTKVLVVEESSRTTDVLNTTSSEWNRVLQRLAFEMHLDSFARCQCDIWTDSRPSQDPFRIYWELPFQCSMLIASFNVTTGWGACSFCHSGLRPFLQRLPIKDQMVHGSLELLHCYTEGNPAPVSLGSCGVLPHYRMRWRDREIGNMWNHSAAGSLRCGLVDVVDSLLWPAELEADDLKNLAAWGLLVPGGQLQREVQEKKTDIAHICSLWLINLELFHVDLLWVPRNQNLLASVCSSLRHVAWMFHQSQTSATFRGQLGRKVHVVLACGDRHHVFRVTTCYACSTRS